MLKLTGAAAAAALLLSVSPLFAMGGGGSGSGSYNLPSTASHMQSSDYDVALRLIKHKQYADAIPHLELALADKPKDADILNYLGYTKRMVGDYDASLDYYTRALAIDPNHKGVHEYLGELYLQKNDMPSAQKELATLTTLCPSGCDERDALTQAIAEYKPTTPAPATPAGAAPASTPSSTTSSSP
jgi:tetratricopeptide (TPR) repeat protein